MLKNDYGDFSVIGYVDDYAYPNGRVVKCVLLQCNCCGRFRKVPQGSINGTALSHKNCSFLVDRENEFFTSFYNKWGSMKDRIYSQTTHNYSHYGGRGLTTDFDLFIDFYDNCFSSFLEHVDKYGLKNTTLERIDVNKGYVIGNITWATMSEQASNKQKGICFYHIDLDNKKHYYNNLKSFCLEHDLKRTTVRRHLSHGYNFYGGFLKECSYEEFLNNREN